MGVFQKCPLLNSLIQFWMHFEKWKIQKNFLCSYGSAERRDFKAAIFQTADCPEISHKRRFCSSASLATLLLQFCLPSNKTYSKNNLKYLKMSKQNTFICPITHYSSSVAIFSLSLFIKCNSKKHTLAFRKISI